MGIGLAGAQIRLILEIYGLVQHTWHDAVVYRAVVNRILYMQSIVGLIKSLIIANMSHQKSHLPQYQVSPSINQAMHQCLFLGAGA